MKSRRTALRMFIWVTGCFLCTGLGAQQSAPLLQAVPQVQALQHDPLSPFTAEDAHVFFLAAAEADKLNDAMQRCLRFPNPPGSHWSPATVSAYCHYRLQAMIGFQELKALVQSGHAQEVDRRFAEWSKQPAEHPEFFWRFLHANFFSPRPEARDVLEAWKQQMPGSAFAHAASGFSFVMDARRIRGGKFASDTAQERFDAMDSPLSRAVGDLQRAIKLNPHLGPAYAALMDMGMLQGDAASLKAIGTEGLRADPASYPIFDALALASAPKWYGSREAQANVLVTIDRQTATQPLLAIVRTSILVEQTNVDFCGCSRPDEREAYRKAFDQVGSGSELVLAGKNALDNGQNELAAIYLAEALRFDPNDAVTRAEYNTALSGVQSTVAVH